MAGGRQATNVVVANGRKHFTKAELDVRRDSEYRVAVATKISVPKWLEASLHKEFRVLGKQLLAAGLFTILDEDTLGRYLIARRDYNTAQRLASEALCSGDFENAKDWSVLQERYFKQCRGCASDLGLTMASRCRLVIPPPMQDQEGEGGDDFSKMLHQRQMVSAKYVERVDG